MFWFFDSFSYFLPLKVIVGTETSLNVTAGRINCSGWILRTQIFSPFSINCYFNCRLQLLGCCLIRALLAVKLYTEKCHGLCLRGCLFLGW
jgi:hypothetical protein